MGWFTAGRSEETGRKKSERSPLRPAAYALSCRALRPHRALDFRQRAVLVRMIEPVAEIVPHAADLHGLFRRPERRMRHDCRSPRIRLDQRRIASFTLFTKPSGRTGETFSDRVDLARARCAGFHSSFIAASRYRRGRDEKSSITPCPPKMDIAFLITSVESHEAAIFWSMMSSRTLKLFFFCSMGASAAMPVPVPPSRDRNSP